MSFKKAEEKRLKGSNIMKGKGEIRWAKNWEPAEVLLERIKAERVNNGNK
jgi:hypothetical protein